MVRRISLVVAFSLASLCASAATDLLLFQQVKDELKDCKDSSGHDIPLHDRGLYDESITGLDNIGCIRSVSQMMMDLVAPHYLKTDPSLDSAQFSGAVFYYKHDGYIDEQNHCVTVETAWLPKDQRILGSVSWKTAISCSRTVLKKKEDVRIRTRTRKDACGNISQWCVNVADDEPYKVLVTYTLDDHRDHQPQPRRDLSIFYVGDQIRSVMLTYHKNVGVLISLELKSG